ncbi:hypothetical protein BGX20_005596, partial [Mortierella sp. AD010]
IIDRATRVAAAGVPIPLHAQSSLNAAAAILPNHKKIISKPLVSIQVCSIRSESSLRNSDIGNRY